MTTLTLEPASAVAVAKCLVSRSRPVAGLNHADYHPRPCAWEDFTRDDLSRLLDDFNAEARYHVDVERFHALPRSEQARLVLAAQYPDTEETR